MTLKPGQALYLSAGNLHAYLFGVGVEIMANSDNVLRGGLTPKHVDVPELMRVLDFSAGDVKVLDGGGPEGGEIVYPTPAPEFRLSRLSRAHSDPARLLDHDGPQVLLVTSGELVLTDSTGMRVAIGRGRSAWIAARDREVRLTGDGTAFRALDGLDPTGP